MDTFNVGEYIFPLGGANRDHDTGIIHTRAIYGTAFYLGTNVFITAGHSIQNCVSKHEVMTLGYLEGNAFKFTGIGTYEVLTNYDIGFFQAEMPKAKAIPWDFRELPLLTEVRTMGFPHALDYEEHILRIRALQGYIVSASEHRLLSSIQRYYELSFHCPRGISGAPLFKPKTKPILNGIVLGSSLARMPVASTKEMINEDKEWVYEVWDTMSFGIAITTETIQNVESKIMGGTLLDHLKTENLA